MKTWWQVYIYDEKGKATCFGFATINDIIVDHPDYKWKGVELKDYKLRLLSQKAKVCKISETV